MSRTAAVVDSPQASEGQAWSARRRQATAPPAGGPCLEELSRVLAEHDVTVASSSLSKEEAQAFMAEHG